MDQLIAEHIDAEQAGDRAASVAMYTDNVEHDVVGFPTGPVAGKAAAQGFYEYLFNQIQTQTMELTHSYYGESSCIQEHLWGGTVPGEFMGLPGHGREISFRILHIWEFSDGLMSRENVWLDGAAIMAQLSAPVGESAAATA
jgi:steroid delta-isomerase-like uncharacterized protein